MNAVSANIMTTPLLKNKPAGVRRKRFPAQRRWAPCVPNTISVFTYTDLPEHVAKMCSLQVPAS